MTDDLAARRVTYYHGGVPRLKRGEYILPPVEMENPFCQARWGNAVTRADRVYLTTDPAAAALFAAGYPGGGWVYCVEPDGPLLPDPDCTEFGLSWMCTRARIKRVHWQLSQAETAHILREVMRA